MDLIAYTALINASIAIVIARLLVIDIVSFLSQNLDERERT
jgi:hypothetical protein